MTTTPEMIVVERECESCWGNGVIREPDGSTRKCLDCTGTGMVAHRCEMPSDVVVGEIRPGDKDIELTARRDPEQSFRVTVSRDDCDTKVAEAVARKLAAAYNEIDTLRAKLEECKRAGFIDDKGNVRKVLGTLPVTADGVLVTPGMTVFPPCGHSKPLTPSCFMPVRVEEVSCWEGSCHHEYFGENDYHESDPTKYPVSKCYSTKAALTAHSQPAKTEEGGASQ